jgi:hypothetical protein
MATDKEIRDAGYYYIPPQEYLASPFKIPAAAEVNVPPAGETGILATDAFNDSTNIFAGYDDKIGAPGASPFLNMSQADFNKQLFETGPYADPYAQTDYNKFPMADPLNQKIADKLRENEVMDAKYSDEDLIQMYGNQNYKGGMFEEDDEEFNLMDYIPFVGSKSAFQGIMNAIVPKADSRYTDIRDYYGGAGNLDSIGRIKTGLMAGYAPVSGGFLNTITKGRYGSPTTYGLQRAYQKRIDTIKKTLANKYKDGNYDDTELDERLAKLEAEKAAEQKALQTAQAKKDYNTIQDAYAKQTGAGSSYSGGDRNREARSTGNYHDPFDPGHAD